MSISLQGFISTIDSLQTGTNSFQTEVNCDEIIDELELDIKVEVGFEFESLNDIIILDILPLD